MTKLGIFGTPSSGSYQSGVNISVPIQTYSFTSYVPLVLTAVVVNVPVKTFIKTDYPINAGTGDTFVNPLTTFNFTSYVPSVASGAAFSVNTKAFEFYALTPSVGAGASITIPLKTFTLNFEVPEQAGPNPANVIQIPLKTFTLTHGVEIIKGVNVQMPEPTEFVISSGIDYFKLRTVTSCAGEIIPLDHMIDSRKLEADAYVDLFEILLNDNSSRIALKMNSEVTWQGNTYQGTIIQIEGVGHYADDQVSRPKLSIFNPEGIYSSLVDQGLLDNAKITRIRVLKEHLDQDLPIYRRQQWRVSRIASLSTPMISLELRDMLDGQNFLTPGRMFIPPDFPSVNIG